MSFLPGFLSIDIRPNQKSEQTIRESASLFGGARESIRIVAGRLDASFYSDQRIVRALNNAIGKGASVVIAYYPHENHSVFSGQLKEKVPGARLTMLKDKPMRHWAVVDGKHLRIERKHDEGTSETPAIICKNARSLADEFTSKFETFLK